MQPLNSRGLSANTLFHFTSSLDNLINILTNEFHPNFCLEGLNVLFKEPKLELAIPILSFCDIPLSQTGFHLNVYGDYGIGLTKSWGKQNGISPVLAMRTQVNLKLAETSRLSFEPKDIRYLVVRQEEEIVPLINQIEQIKEKYSYYDVRLARVESHIGRTNRVGLLSRRSLCF